MGEIIKKEFLINSPFIPDFRFDFQVPGFIKIVVESFGSSGIKEEIEGGLIDLLKDFNDIKKTLKSLMFF